MYDSSPSDSSPLFQLGLDPDHPFYDLNLAGAQGWPPDPWQVAQTEKAMPVMQPDYGLPDMALSSLKPYDLMQPGIIFTPEFAPDPTLPDLNAFNHPYNVDIINAQGIEPTPEYARDIPTQQEIADALAPGLGFPMLDVRHGVTDVDPSLPDLQNPQLMPETHMPDDERPGTLDPQALEMLRADAHFQSTADKSYPASQMDARGMNDTRARHMSLLTNGLKDG